MAQTINSQSMLQAIIVFIDTIEVLYVNERKSAKRYMKKICKLLASEAGTELESSSPIIVQTAKNMVQEFSVRYKFEKGQFESGYHELLNVATQYIEIQAYPFAVRALAFLSMRATECGWRERARECCRMILQIHKKTIEPRQTLSIVYYLLSVQATFQGEQERVVQALRKTLPGFPKHTFEFEAAAVVDLMYKTINVLSLELSQAIKNWFVDVIQRNKRTDVLLMIYNQQLDGLLWYGHFREAYELTLKSIEIAKKSGDIKNFLSFCLMGYCLANRLGDVTMRDYCYKQLNMRKEYKQYMIISVGKVFYKIVVTLENSDWNTMRRLLPGANRVLDDPSISVIFRVLISGMLARFYMNENRLEDAAKIIKNLKKSIPGSNTDALLVLGDLTTIAVQMNSKIIDYGIDVYENLERVLHLNTDKIDGSLSKQISTIENYSQSLEQLLVESTQYMVVQRKLDELSKRSNKENSNEQEILLEARRIHDYKHLVSLAKVSIDKLLSDTTNDEFKKSLKETIKTMANIVAVDTVNNLSVEKETNRIVQMVKPLMKDKELVLHVDSAKRGSKIFSKDLTILLRAVLFNLVVNSLEHSSSKKPIELKVVQDNDAIVVEIKNEIGNVVTRLSNSQQYIYERNPTKAIDVLFDAYKKKRGLGLIILDKLIENRKGEFSARVNNNTVDVYVRIPI